MSDVYHNMYVSSSFYNVNVKFSFIINYVSKHQLSHVIDTSHTMPTVRTNRGLMLLKLIEEILFML